MSSANRYSFIQLFSIQTFQRPLQGLQYASESMGIYLIPMRYRDVLSKQLYLIVYFPLFYYCFVYCEYESETVSCSVMSDSLQPHGCSPPDYSVHAILQAKILERVAIPFSRGSSLSGNQTQVSCIVGGMFTI